jgi:hypothetical protein
VGVAGRQRLVVWVHHDLRAGEWKAAGPESVWEIESELRLCRFEVWSEAACGQEERTTNT